MYSSSVGNSIQASANRRDSQNVGCTGPIKQARPPSLRTLHVKDACVSIFTPLQLQDSPSPGLHASDNTESELVLLYTRGTQEHLIYT